MNPLDASWSKKRPAPDSAPGQTPFRGVRTEATVAGADGPSVRFEVRGVPGAPSGTFRVEWSPGAPLRWYLRKLRMLGVASRAAFYDVVVGDGRRLRLRYQPTDRSVIMLTPAGFGPKSHLQRSSVDAQAVAVNMGKERGRPAPRIVERKLP
jgi:hypothetical protein